MDDNTDPAAFAVPTLQTRVESWECDFNDHWNARYYSRSFQMAAETVAALAGGENPGMAAIALRVIRFHRELRAGAAVEIRSLRVADGPHAGAAVHLLSSAGALSATAFDLPGTGASRLPAIRSGLLATALPRGDILAKLAATSRPGDHLTMSGPVRPDDLDHRGALLYETIIRRVGHGMYDRLALAGLTPEFTRDTGIGRMAAQSSVRPVHRPCPPGTVLRVRSRISQVGAKIFSTWHCLEAADGTALAHVAHDMLAVDLERRRAVTPPAFLQDAVG
ncbi:hypothetical protein EQ718_12605 [Paracoccus versutus]|uniref:Acyl-CoA thioester hydrolase n=1 Tax=Paracoccus versutus TaxID=34007 RepID=A0AAQ0HBW5_PARVE|nr:MULTISPECIES: thioesterase family protein [Paracoccus]SFY45813.1 Acyl-CoA thioesterase FadM [Paracoccus pantotrophus]KGJ01752.1 hypothetical protein IT40_26905 [Paracoccus versutus]MBT0778710.1 hypothetical protein [Paracoccus sp. pheM1]RDD70357.1 hypothetical protein DVR11_16615 [Paracoccus versutus]REG26291.1 acyl-CoA thioester hydrolase [Paracoccus versutus]